MHACFLVSISRIRFDTHELNLCLCTQSLSETHLFTNQIRGLKFSGSVWERCGNLQFHWGLSGGALLTGEWRGGERLRGSHGGRGAKGDVSSVEWRSYSIGEGPEVLR